MPKSQSTSQLKPPSNSHSLQIDAADLRLYPKARKSIDENSETTLGDLHGNALKLLFSLIREGYVYLNEEDYSKFVEIYYRSRPFIEIDLGYGIKVTKLTEEAALQFETDLKAFNSIVANLDIIDASRVYRLIGDDLADRGENDYWSLRLIVAILTKLNSSLLHSNHTAAFLKAYYTQHRREIFNLKSICIPGDSFTRSLRNLNILFNSGLVKRQEIDNLMQEYCKLLKMIDYTIHQDREGNLIFTIYTHAPTDLNIIKGLFNECGCPEKFNDSSIQELAKSIDFINAKISDPTLLKELLNKDVIRSYFGKLLWNRDLNLDRQNASRGRDFRIVFVNGHNYEPSEGNVYCVDESFGKGPIPNGQYSSLRTLSTKGLFNNLNREKRISRQSPVGSPAKGPVRSPQKLVRHATKVKLTPRNTGSDNELFEIFLSSAPKAPKVRPNSANDNSITFAADSDASGEAEKVKEVQAHDRTPLRVIFSDGEKGVEHERQESQQLTNPVATRSHRATTKPENKPASSFSLISDTLSSINNVNASDQTPSNSFLSAEKNKSEGEGVQATKNSGDASPSKKRIAKRRNPVIAASASQPSPLIASTSSPVPPIKRIAKRRRDRVATGLFSNPAVAAQTDKENIPPLLKKSAHHE